MDQEKHGGRRVSTGESEDDLRAVLEEAERRKESEWKRTGRFASLMIWVPVLLLLAWAGVFLVQYPSGEDQNAAVKPVVVVAGVATPATQDPKEMAELNAFLPPALRGGKAAKKPPSAGPVVNQEDIRFAMELLNYCRLPSASKEDGKK